MTSWPTGTDEKWPRHFHPSADIRIAVVVIGGRWLVSAEWFDQLDHLGRWGKISQRKRNKWNKVTHLASRLCLR